MNLVRRYSTRWHFRKRDKPTRLLELRPTAGRPLAFRPSRMGLPLKRYEFETYRVQVKAVGSEQ